MSKDELMNPRYKVIADFWDNPFYIGQVLTFKILREPILPPLEELESGNVTKYLYTEFIAMSDGGSASYCEKSFSQYPNLFKELKWWEERDETDLPKYALSKTSGHVLKLTAKDCRNGFFMNAETHYDKWWMNHFIPASESEYLEYQRKVESNTPITPPFV